MNTLERITVPTIRFSKVKNGHEPLTMITAYDYPGAKMVDKSGADMILVGDSLAMVVLGQPDTMCVTIEIMEHHTRAVAAAKSRALIVADMPWMTYHTSKTDAIKNAAKLIRAGASAVKLEGGAKRRKVITAISDAEIPIVGHLGLTPQSIKELGVYKVQAKSKELGDKLIQDALILQDLGVFALVLEAIPESVASAVTDELNIPTIGIGAGSSCDGQVLVFHDLLGFDIANKAKFVKTYANLEDVGSQALSQFVKDVRTGEFPSKEHTYH